MGIHEQVNVIRADDTKTATEKRAAINALRRAAVRATIDRLPFTFTRGKYEVSVLDAGIRNGHFWLKISCKVNGIEVIRDPDFYWNTVPVLVPDIAGDIDINGTMFREDAGEALKQIVVAAIRNHVRE